MGAQGGMYLLSSLLVNGVPSCANDWLIDQTARNEWGFDGYITSDCDAGVCWCWGRAGKLATLIRDGLLLPHHLDDNVYSTHHYTATPEEAVRDVLVAGMSNAGRLG